MSKIISLTFFQNKNTVQIAKNLLGKFLVRRYRGKTTAYAITEVEAYDGFKDKASHAHRGKTERNKAMFGPAGYWYVYFTYGMHWLLNIENRGVKIKPNRIESAPRVGVDYAGLIWSKKKYRFTID